MKYVKGTVSIIEMNEEDIITTSGCTDPASFTSGNCDTDGHKNIATCQNKGNQTAAEHVGGNNGNGNGNGKGKGNGKG